MGWDQILKKKESALSALGDGAGKKKILIIDDDPRVIRMLKLFIGEEDYLVFSAQNGEAGLEIYQREKPHIVLTDVVMPIMSGLDVLKEIRSADDQTEVLVLTGQQDIDVAIEALKLRASDFILKPFDMDMIRLALGRATERLSLKEKVKAYTMELENLLEQVNYSKNYLETIVKNSPDALMTYDPDGVITSWNEEAEKITGYKAEEAIGSRVEQIFSLEEHLINPDEQGKIEDNIKNVIAQISTKDGRIRSISRNANSILDDKGRFVSAIESFLDITEQLDNEHLLEKRLMQVNTINEISKIVSSRNDLQDVVDFVIHSLHQTYFESSQIAVYVYNPDNLTLDLMGIVGAHKDEVRRNKNISAVQGMMGKVFKSKKPLLCEDVSKLQEIDYEFLGNAQSVFIYPVRRDSRSYGLLSIKNIEKMKADASDRSMLEAIAEFLGISMGRIELLGRITSQNIQLEKQAKDLRKALRKVEQQKDIIEEQNTRLIKDLQKAADFQKSLLPEKLPQFRDIKFSATYIPSSQLGGDFYDVFKIDKDRVGIILADASGHGVAAAMLSAMFKMTFQKHVSESAEPEQVFTRLNRDFCKVLQMGEFFTAFFAVFNRKTKKLLFGNAGHPRPLLLDYQKKSLQELDTNGFLLGVMSEGISFEQKALTVEGRQRLLIYTDGVNESVNDKGEQFGSERIEKIMLQRAGESGREYLRNIKSDVVNFTGTKIFDDDITMLVMDLN